MPDQTSPIPWSDESVIFENWEVEGCHVFTQGKHVLTLNTPESTAAGDPYNTLLDDWISPEEFCATLECVLRALGASAAMIGAVENERRRYHEHPVQPPRRTNAALMAEIGFSTGSPRETL